MSAVLSATDKKDHVKWIMVGLVSMFALQVVISLVFDVIIYAIAESSPLFMQNTPIVVIFGLMVGAFLVGGFIVGWKSEQRRILDAVIAAAMTAALNFLIFTQLPPLYNGQFILGSLLSEPSEAVTYLVLGLAAAAAGAYWGWHVTQPEADILEETSISPEHRKNGKAN